MPCCHPVSGRGLKHSYHQCVPSISFGTYSGHGVPRLSPFGDTLVSTGTIDKAEDKDLVNIKDYLTGLDGFDIVYDRNDDYPQIKADDMARLWEIVNNDETLRVLAPVDWN